MRAELCRVEKECCWYEFFTVILYRCALILRLISASGIVIWLFICKHSSLLHRTHSLVRIGVHSLQHWLPEKRIVGVRPCYLCIYGLKPIIRTAVWHCVIRRSSWTRNTASAGRACAPADQHRRFRIAGRRSLGGLFYVSSTVRITLMTRPTTQHCSGSASVDTCLIPLLKIIQLAKIRVHKLNIAETRIYRLETFHCAKVRKADNTETRESRWECCISMWTGSRAKPTHFILLFRMGSLRFFVLCFSCRQ